MSISGQVRFSEPLIGLTQFICYALGKDYSNPRVTDFHTLNKPHDDMYDRTKVPRMPWYVATLKFEYTITLNVQRQA